MGDLSVSRDIDLIQLVEIYRDATINIGSSLERCVATTLDREWAAVVANLLDSKRHILRTGRREPTDWLGVCLLLGPVVLLRDVGSLSFVRHELGKLCIEARAKSLTLVND